MWVRARSIQRRPEHCDRTRVPLKLTWDTGETTSAVEYASESEDDETAFPKLQYMTLYDSISGGPKISIIVIT